MRQLNVEERTTAITLLAEGYSSREIGRRLGGVHHTTILRLKKKVEETGSTENKPGSGRPRKLNERDERECVRKIARGECSTAIAIKKKLRIDDNIDISVRTVRRTLHKHGLVARVKKKKPLLTKKHRQKRLDFAKKHQSWTVEDWSKVIWSDESKFQLFGSDGRQYCWKRPNEPLKPAHVQPTVKFGGGRIFVWGCMTWKGIGWMCRINSKLNAQLYVEILEDDLDKTLDYYDLDVKDIIFMQDNDPKHKAKRTLRWFRQTGLNVLDWPPQSPDLNPIEHVWNEMDRRLHRSEVEIRNKDQLWELAEKIWGELEVEYCQRLISTMPERINDVIKARGGGYTRW